MIGGRENIRNNFFFLRNAVLIFFLSKASRNFFPEGDFEIFFLIIANYKSARNFFSRGKISLNLIFPEKGY